MTLKDGTKVFSINGNYVRDKYHKVFLKDEFHDTFVLGGHDLFYSFIPKDEIWVDDMFNNFDDQLAIICHEATEHALMKYKKMDYDDAHKIANDAEAKTRERFKKARENSLSF